MINGILQYWERSLIDGMKMGPPLDKFLGSEGAVSLSRSDYAAGNMSNLDKLLVIYKESNNEVPDKYPVTVLIFPYIYRPVVSHQYRSSASAIAALCVPASVCLKTGKIGFKQDNPPFIPRRHLRPMDEKFATIGAMADVDNYLTKNIYSPAKWLDVVGFGDGMLKHIFDPENKLQINGAEYQLLEHVIVLPAPPEFTGARKIIDLYRDISESQETPDLPLLKAFSTVSAGQKQNHMDIRGCIASMRKHVGQMNPKFPLSDSQRTALNHFYSDSNGLILAINGPPGTGKTTLLQSIVASYWVGAAITGVTTPVIAACSTNNQAVTNIIESFGNVPQTLGLLSERWLPEVTSYGLYCVSATKDVKPEYQRMDSFIPGVENVEYVQRANEHFISKACEYYQCVFKNVDEVITLLKSRLVSGAAAINSKAGELDALLDIYGAEIVRLQQDKAAALLEAEKQAKLEERRDVLGAERLQAAKWLLSLQEEVSLHKKDLSDAIIEEGRLTKLTGNVHALAVDWAVFGREVSIFTRIFEFLPFVREKWVSRALIHCRELFKDGLLETTTQESIFSVLMSRPKRIDDAVDAVGMHIDRELSTAKELSDQASRLQKDIQGMIGRLEDRQQGVQAKITSLDSDIDAADKNIRSSKDLYRQILSRNGLFEIGKDKIEEYFDRLVAVQIERQKSVNDLYQEVSSHLDTSVRYELFLIATHYWEGTWLKEMQDAFGRGESFPGSKNLRNIQASWIRCSKISPLIVSTFHMAPNVFNAWRKGPDGKLAMAPLYNFIDLLIVDEAGQVGPDVAAPTFALAKKALVVGDLHQIEPIWSVSEAVDRGNVLQYCGHELFANYDQLSNDGLGVSAASGSVMRIAQNQSRFLTDETIYGMFLREHRRCADEIIKYCNELAYGGKLIPCRENADNPGLPRMGWAHIAGACRSSHDGSKLNKVEANVIVAWIVQRKEALEAYYGMEIQDIIAIITPFKAQQAYLKQELKRHKLRGLVAGTIHSLQGAERKVVILSPVYDLQTAVGTMFFDRGKNMLNVAVSRAVDSFLVFGETRIFNQRKNSPSGLLARHLFFSPDNEVTDLPPNLVSATRPLGAYAHAEIITTLVGHTTVLLQAIASAQERVVIASPWITQQAIYADNLLQPLKIAIAKGVKITIYTDNDFNTETGGDLSKTFVGACADLVDAGVEVKILNRVHNKDLIVDSDTLVCGSFNWLSAVRDENHFYSKRNSSIKISGEEVKPLVNNIIDEMENLFAAGGKLYSGQSRVM